MNTLYVIKQYSKKLIVKLLGDYRVYTTPFFNFSLGYTVLSKNVKNI